MTSSPAISTPKVHDEFLQWIKDMFGQLREVQMTRGPLHDFNDTPIYIYIYISQTVIHLTR